MEAADMQHDSDQARKAQTEAVERLYQPAFVNRGFNGWTSEVSVLQTGHYWSSVSFPQVTDAPWVIILSLADPLHHITHSGLWQWQRGCWEDRFSHSLFCFISNIHRAGGQTKTINSHLRRRRYCTRAIMAFTNKVFWWFAPIDLLKQFGSCAWISVVRLTWIFLECGSSAETD